VRRGERPNQPPPPHPLGARPAAIGALLGGCTSQAQPQDALHHPPLAQPWIDQGGPHASVAANASQVFSGRLGRADKVALPARPGRPFNRPRGIHLRVLLLLSRVVSSLV